MLRALGNRRATRSRSCLLCQDDNCGGWLCERHEHAVANSTLTPEQAQDRVSSPTASLVGPIGIALRVASGGVLGRAPASDIGVLHESVSAFHARFDEVKGHWVLTDLASRAGTSINGKRLVATESIERGDLIRFGGISFYFWPDVVRVRTSRGITPLVNALAFRIVRDAAIVLVPADTDRACVLVRGRVASFTRREHMLLAMLAQRAVHVADADLACVDTTELACALGYGKTVGNENVRELVYRLRSKLALFDLGDLIEHVRGSGYRLAAGVTFDVDQAPMAGAFQTPSRSSVSDETRRARE